MTGLWLEILATYEAFANLAKKVGFTVYVLNNQSTESSWIYFTYLYWPCYIFFWRGMKLSRRLAKIKYILGVISRNNKIACILWFIDKINSSY